MALLASAMIFKIKRILPSGEAFEGNIKEFKNILNIKSENCTHSDSLLDAYFEIGEQR